MSKILQATVKNLDTASLGKGNYFLTENLTFQHISLSQDLHFLLDILMMWWPLFLDDEFTVNKT